MPTGAVEEEFSLADLLDTTTEVASRVDLPGRESPGVLTVLTRQDIERTGARDLAELLAYVPGLGLGVDVQGVVGPTVRGLWGHEGKVLVLVDGHEVNEIAYSSTPLLNHVPLALAETVTIIRGPGSTMYGGFAELTVIDIVTRAAAGSGTTATGRYEATTATGTRLNDTLGVATRREGDDLSIGVLAWGGDGSLTDRPYVDAYGARVDMARKNTTQPLWVALDVARGAASARVAVDGYRTTMIDAFDEAEPTRSEEGFRGVFAQGRVGLAPGPGWTVTPNVSFKLQQPWHNTSSGPDSLLYLDMFAARTRAGVDATYAVNDDVTAIGGALFQWDHAFGERSTFGEPFDLYNVGAYAEFVGRWTFATVSAGVRAEENPLVGPMFGPRVAVTRTFGADGHVKLLAARGFRSPGVFNVIDGAVRPEAVDTFEAEGGLALGEKQYVTINAYDATMRNPIVYYYEVDDLGNEDEGYTNESRAGTRGVEAQYRLVTERVDAWVTYAVYTAGGRPQVEGWTVADHPNVLLGAPAQKGTMVVTVRPTDTVAITPSLVSQTQVYAYAGYGEDDELVPVVLPPATQLAVDARVAIADTGLSVALGARDLLDQSPALAQPYDGGHPPLPGAGRSVYLRLDWDAR